jgi:release factor glutamine methyltransferase
MTIEDALDVSQRSVSFREAEILLAYTLKKDRSWLHAHPGTVLTASQAERYETCLTRRETNEPVAYITGHKEFYGRPFLCDRRALIPRPETEGLIDRALAWAETQKDPVSILELGTGCGNIAVTLAAELGQRNICHSILATDISAEALELAKANATALETPDITFVTADLFDHPLIQKLKPFALLIANLPYVPDTWKMDAAAQPDVVFFEPNVALFGGGDGLDIYRRFFHDAPTYLAPESKLLIEFHEEQTKFIATMAEKAFPGKEIIIHQDYAKLDRCLEM